MPTPPRRILHLDMDAFFASIEQADNPELKGKPVIVGGSKRGVVSASSYEARVFGVRSAMPVTRAKRLCPHGVFLPVRFTRYREVSRRVMALLNAYSPLVEPASIDEAYLDATGLEGIFGPIDQLCRRIKDDIRTATGLTCSIGAAPVKFLAKIASDFRKPDGVFIIKEEDVAAFLRALPVSKIPGVGAKGEASLKALGVGLVGDILRFPEDFWIRRFGKWGEFLYARAQGKDSRAVETAYEAKSESAENTFAEDTDDPEILRAWLMVQAERVGRSLRRAGTPGRTITLKLKYADFTSITRSHTLPAPTAATLTIFEAAAGLLAHVALKGKVRLIGLGVSHFIRGPRQLGLPLDLPASGREAPAAQAEEQRARLDEVLDEIKDRFGAGAVVRGRIFKFPAER